MKLYIKNMVCRRCEIVVKSELAKLGLHPLSVNLGEVELEEDNIKYLKNELNAVLNSFGFELIDDKNSRLIERVKTLIIDLIHQKNNDLHINLSSYLSQNLKHDYNSLSSLFSSFEQITIEHFFIKQKIEKVKELLMYEEMTLSQIADQLNYSSVAYLSNQFKKETGFTPSNFKRLKTIKRNGIDRI
ncbi:hypothetical protein HME7025_02091 [Aquirufa nivalisilvae]|jgi:AraC-like DNA-binding protein|uniref:HTH araC/xylS-type domain-containing protein n=2 Tax=Aquirufa nivalisilvae TaxID=2516557 RepID=A0A2S2DX72_9BACT|nr:hypothetical protein HME7025_02091 [Aquirufa nivalisilvae]